MKTSLLADIMSGFTDTLKDIVNMIPKIVYFLYACLASAVDALQALIRKLAGLDIYYRMSSSALYRGEATAVAQRDPLTEFIYGILGMGDNAYIYKGLSTVFWSLTIFAVILLAIATMVAIIKSHYNEDTNGTSPWKYIYQAIKAILTFIAIPAMVLLGLRLNTFLLSTLDRIFAGSGSEEEIVSMYGSEAASNFKAEQLEGSNPAVYCYFYYDYFGLGNPTTSSSFSGMLFKAAAFSCNRARNSDVSYTAYKDIQVNGVSIFGADEVLNGAGGDEAQEIVATQIDYAFAGNLHLVESMNYDNVKQSTGLEVTKWTDIGGPVFSGTIKSFTKFRPGVVWQFYNLWEFNFILGFAAVFATFSMMISIIIGLMSRLIKGTALFLIYPALLGLAPLDNFKAFKDWGSQFMKQVLMTIGSIIGVNLLLLILPYMQLIRFYNIGVLDAFINVIMLIVGLSMAKDFISMVSQFVGGENAMQAGDNLKGTVAGNLKKGIGTTAKLGLGTARVMGKVAALPARAVIRGTAKIRANRQARKAEEAEGKVAGAEKDKDNAIKNRNSFIEGRLTVDDKVARNEQISKARSKAKKDYLKSINKKESELDADELKEMNEAQNEAGKKARSDFYDSKATEMDKQIAAGGGKDFKDDWRKLQKGVSKADEGIEDAQKEVDSHRAREKQIADKYGLKQVGGKYEGKGLIKSAGEKLSNFAEGASQMAKKFVDTIDSGSIGKTIADAFTKGVADIGANLGLDKTFAAAADVFKGTLSFKGGAFDSKPELSGDKLAKENAKKAEEAATEHTKLLRQIAEGQKQTATNTSEVAKSAQQNKNNSGSNNGGNNNSAPK